MKDDVYEYLEEVINRCATIEKLVNLRNLTNESFMIFPSKDNDAIDASLLSKLIKQELEMLANLQNKCYTEYKRKKISIVKVLKEEKK